MTRSRCIFLAMAVCCVSSYVASDARTEDVPKDATEAEKRIYRELNSPTKIDFTDEPLSGVVDFLKDYHRIPIVIDIEALKKKGISPDVQITKEIRPAFLGEGLQVMLKDLQLAFVVDDNALIITTIEDAEKTKQKRRDAR